MATDIWFRNPYNYQRELVEVGYAKVVWDEGILVKKKVDPITHARLYFQGMDWEVMCCAAWGARVYKPGDTLEKPSAVYPVWNYGESEALLYEFIDNPAGQDAEACANEKLDPLERPVFGQKHMIVITGLPSVNTGASRHMLRVLREIRDDFPEVQFHLHGLYSFSAMFGLELGSADMDPRTDAQKGAVWLPMGRKVKYERAIDHAKWVRVVGNYKPADLAIPRVRCMFNIDSARWASQNFVKDKLAAFNKNGLTLTEGFDITSSDADYQPPVTAGVLTAPAKAQPGDKVNCDTCSLATKCSYFREGSVCTLPNAEPKSLAAMFHTRNSDLIIDGLGTLVGANARRLERAMQDEAVVGGVDGDVSKLIGQVFDQGTKLAKLVDPNLRAGAKVQVNVGSGSAVQVNSGNPKQVVAAAFKELEARGIPREQITPAMIRGILESNEDSVQQTMESPKVIEGVIDNG